MVTAAVLAFTVLSVLLGQVNPIVDGPPIVPAPSGSTTTGSTTTNVTNVFPPPDPSVVVETERQAAPVVLRSGLQGLDASAGSGISEIFNLGLGLGTLRHDLIQLPVVHTLNQAMNRIVIGTLALVLAALCLWGMFGQFVGSDGHEAFEALARVPLWCLMALTSWSWFGLVLDLFTAIGGVIASQASGAFGHIMTADFWNSEDIGLFAMFVGIVLLLNLVLFSLQLFANTAFLAFCALSAPVFVFMKSTPWTARWGNNWFRMVPGTAGDMLAMLSLLVIGTVGLALITDQSALATICLDLGLLLCLPLIRRLFGLEGNSVGGQLFSAALLARAIRSARTPTPRAGAAAAPAVAAGTVSTTSTTTPTRAPRWGYQSPATSKRNPWTAGSTP